MSKWIDYDAIDYRFDRIQDQSSDFIGGIVYANACVNDAPSIDIVFCKECKHWLINSKLCKHWSRYYGSVLTNADDFCSYGEREGE